MNPYLFVYGTLLSTAGHPQGARLRRQSRLVGAASIPGRLYRLSHYPGLVETPDCQVRVYGEVYKLNSPVTAFKWLDAYEGILPGAGAPSEYTRVERPALLASGDRLIVWAYVYQAMVAPDWLIPDGRWQPP